MPVIHLPVHLQPPQKVAAPAPVVVLEQPMATAFILLVVPAVMVAAALLPSAAIPALLAEIRGVQVHQVLRETPATPAPVEIHQQA
jgi:hypothetical protein